MTHDRHQPLNELLDHAANGSQDAWNDIVDRYGAIVWSVCRQFRLSSNDAADISQTVWLRVLESLSSLREPAAFPGWLATITRRECIRAHTATSRRPWSLAEWDVAAAAEDETTDVGAALLVAERNAMLREAFAALPAHCQELLALMFAPDPRPYAEIGARLSMPTGSIGPTRARCLEKLRTCPVVVRWLSDSSIHTAGGPR